MSGNGPQPMYPPSMFKEYITALEGSSVACILYGVYLVISGSNMVLLQKKRYRIILAYSIVQLVLTTLYFAFSLYGIPAQSLGIFNIVSSGGPDALSSWPSVVVDILFVLNTWISDAFLLYRCYIVCMGNMYASALPMLLYTATVGASLAWLAVSSMPGAVYSNRVVQVTGICYWSCSAAMNACASCLISARLLMYRHAISRVLGVQQGAFYLGYMAMTLESALLYTAFVIAALVVFVLNSPLENVFFPVLGMVQAIAPSLIIYRIARGIAFQQDTGGSVAAGSLRFASSVRSRNIGRTVRQDTLDSSGTIHASSSDSIKIDKCGSQFSIHTVKEDV